MTDEEKVNNYELACIADVYQDDVCTIPYAYSAQKLEQAYLDGLAEGRKEKWHDLRKNPGDLPKCTENEQIIFYVKDYYESIKKYINHYCLGFYKKSFMNDDVKLFVERSKGYECEHLPENVLYWCELPEFKE